MPLTLFQGNIKFPCLSKEDASWTIFPSTIEYLTAELFYGETGEFFEFPKNPSWKQLFPSLKSLKLPLDSLVELPLATGLSTASVGQISGEQIESIRSSFPESLTHLEMTPIDSDFYECLPMVVLALGHRLTRYNFENCRFSSDMLKWMPKWENPSVKFTKIITDDIRTLEIAPKDENMETKFSLNKKHPISHLYRNATSFDTEKIPASKISLLPRTLTSLTFAMDEQEPLSLKNLFLERFSSSISELGWPPNVTKIRMTYNGGPLHLHGLPFTLKELCIVALRPMEVESGSDFSVFSKLSIFQVLGASKLLVNTLHGLPRSLNTLSAASTRVTADSVFLEPDFQNFFFNLERLVLTGRDYSADVLLYVPKTLKALLVSISATGPCLNEKHFENIAKTKLAYLSFQEVIKWPKTLNFDVFSRFMPSTFAYLALDLDESQMTEGFEKELAPHIPNTLLEFDSDNSLLCDLVRDRMKQKNSP